MYNHSHNDKVECNYAIKRKTVNGIHYCVLLHIKWILLLYIYIKFHLTDLYKHSK